MLKIGDKAPEFTLLNQDEVEISLKDLKGKWIILYFYPKDNTAGCTKEACDFSNGLDFFDDLDAIILGVSPDSAKAHRNFIEKQNLKITLLVDSEKEVMKSYFAYGIKKNYGKEYEGVIRSTFIINPDGLIAGAFYNVKATGHVERIKKEFQKIKG
jgi:peroxiredoxin Q/BCP